MNNTQVFTNLMQNAINMTLGRVRNAIIDNGVDNCENLVSLTSEDVKELFQSIESLNRNLNANQVVRITTTMKKRFEALRKELKMRRSCTDDYDEAQLNAITTETLDSWITKHNEWDALTSSKSTSTLPEVTIPKLTQANWREWKNSFSNSLSRIIGDNKIPLTYIVRDEEIGDYDDTYSSTEKQLTTCIKFEGTSVNNDKAKVFSLLEEHLKGTHMQSIVQNSAATRDGRKAWKAIRDASQTTSHNNTLTNMATSMMNNARYKGETANFGIDKYYAKHIEAHNMLVEADSPLSEAQKITNFKNGIVDNVAIMYATFVTTQNPTCTTFAAWYGLFSDMIKSHINHNVSNTKSSQRGIHQVNGSARGRGRDGYGRGRSNRGRRGRGRYGRGRGNRGGYGRGRQYRHNPTGTQFKPKFGTYSPDEWKELTYEQKQEVSKFREYCNSYNSGTTNDTNRNVNQATSNNERGNEMTKNENDKGSKGAQQGRAGDAFAPNKKNK